MMGVQDPLRGKPYYSNFNLDKRIRANRLLRKIDQFTASTSSTKRWQTSIVSRVMFPSLRPSSSSSCCSIKTNYSEQGGLEANRDASYRPRGGSS
jgi:hypothetical protein